MCVGFTHQDTNMDVKSYVRSVMPLTRSINSDLRTYCSVKYDSSMAGSSAMGSESATWQFRNKVRFRSRSRARSGLVPGPWALRHCTSDTRRYSSASRIMAGPMKLPKFSVESICGNESLHVTDPGDLGET